MCWDYQPWSWGLVYIKARNICSYSFFFVRKGLNGPNWNKLEFKNHLKVSHDHTRVQDVILFATSCGRPYITGNFIQKFYCFTIAPTHFI